MTAHAAAGVWVAHADAVAVLATVQAALRAEAAPAVGRALEQGWAQVQGLGAAAKVAPEQAGTARLVAAAQRLVRAPARVGSYRAPCASATASLAAALALAASTG